MIDMSFFFRNHQDLTSRFPIRCMLRLIRTCCRKDRLCLMRRGHNVAFRRCAKSGITDDADRISSSRYPTGKTRVIRPHRSDPRHDPHIAVTVLLHIFPCVFPGDPLRSPRRCRDLSIECHCVFHHHIRSFCFDVMKKYGV